MLRKRILAGIAASGLLALTLAADSERRPGIQPPRGAADQQGPAADNTDLYAFVSPDKPDTVTIIANYIPLEEPAGGPNFNAFGDDVLYEINIDNTGDGEEDISYQFRFKTKIRNPNTFLYNTGPISSLNDPNWNMPQTYSVTRVKGGKSKTAGRQPASARR